MRIWLGWTCPGMPLESGLEAGYAWLTLEKAERLNISSLGARHVWPESLESG
jgi:hypothetical protein